MKYTSIPFRFKSGNTFTETVLSENVSPSQFRLILREKKNGKLEGALQTKTYFADIKYSGKVGKGKIETYHDLKGKFINAWLYENGEPVRIYKKAFGGLSNGRLSGCETFESTSYSTRCDYPDGANSTNDLVCRSIPNTDFYTFCDYSGTGQQDQEEQFPPDQGGGDETTLPKYCTIDLVHLQIINYFFRKRILYPAM